MQEVVKKIEELYTLLEHKLKVNEKVVANQTATGRDLDEMAKKLVAKSKNLAAMERIYKKYVDFDSDVKKFTAERKDYSEDRALLEKQTKDVEKKLAKLDEENKKLDTRKLAMSKQAIALKEKEANFDKKKADLKAMISGQAIKDMLK